MAARSLRRWAILALAAAGACAAPPAAAPPKPAPTPPPAPFIAPPPPQAPPTQAAPTPQPADSCGASELQYLIGKPRSEIPIPLVPSHRRVVCSTCPMTQDFVPYRQTIIYDSTTGLVRSISCR